MTNEKEITLLTQKFEHELYSLVSSEIQLVKLKTPFKIVIKKILTILMIIFSVFLALEILFSFLSLHCWIHNCGNNISVTQNTTHYKIICFYSLICSVLVVLALLRYWLNSSIKEDEVTSTKKDILGRIEALKKDFTIKVKESAN